MTLRELAFTILRFASCATSRCTMSDDDNPSSAALTAGDSGTLERAADLRLRFDAGIFPSTIGQRSYFQRLEFDSWHRDIDGELQCAVPR